MKLYRINALLLKWYYISITSLDRMFDIFYWPIIDLFVWGFTAFYIESLSDYNVISFLMGGLILWTFTWRAYQDIGTYVLEDFWNRALYHLFSSPILISEYIISVLIVALTRGLITFGFLTLLTYLMYSFNIFTLPLFLLGAVSGLLILFGWTMGIFVAGLLMRFGQRIQVLAWSLIWIVQPFSCVFYPLSSMPSWSADIAKVLPTTHAFEAMRNAFSGLPVNYGSLWYSFFVSIGLLVVMSLFFAYCFKNAKRKGLLLRGD